MHVCGLFKSRRNFTALLVFSAFVVSTNYAVVIAEFEIDLIISNIIMRRIVMKFFI